jgi:heme O synthase-like polyprenyltransferase
MVTLAAIALFLVVFCWQPIHFYALAIKRKDEYALANIPMLPSVKGFKRTRVSIWIGCQQNTTKNSAIAVKLICPSIATHPISGGTAPGQISLTAIALFLVVFCWQPIHFYALAIKRKDEY